jgi:hypothetical protein
MRGKRTGMTRQVFSGTIKKTPEKEEAKEFA